ncbi:hypothetical protein HOLleu_10691 [Holothuria leucospilota]|uniref:Tesmin/TSO1-like CXC domain-containing protein n=1 Tax=Holothuria leucospilota TaxID=206669 RepID=A0A9Q1CF28_HOLLE|nr:hypothetical protein HOLleu_10691 [Holothuria leucospilota]
MADEFSRICAQCLLPTDGKEDKLQTARQSTRAKILDYAVEFEKTDLLNYLNGDSSLQVKIHRSCQRRINNELRSRKRHSSSQGPIPVKNPRVSTRGDGDSTKFDFKKECMFLCRKVCGKDEKHTNRHLNDFSEVRTLGFKETILSVCKQRNDKLSLEIKKNLLSCHDLVAVEARYHRKCYQDFVLTCKKTETKGRPVDMTKEMSFNRLCEWLESECEQYTLSELHDIWQEQSPGIEVYCAKTLKTKLLQRYGNEIVICNTAGNLNVVTLKTNADSILTNKWYNDRKDDPKDDAVRVITAAAELLKSSIRTTAFDVDHYPKNELIEDHEKGFEWLPELLRVFLGKLINHSLRRVSIGHSIIYATRPRSSIAPIPFALGVEVDHVFGSEWLSNELSALGYALGQAETIRFKQAVTENENTLSLLSTFIEGGNFGSFTHFIADNVDHNMSTIDGSNNAFHAMGIIAATTTENPEGLANGYKLPPVKRYKLKKASQATKKQVIPIHYYDPPTEVGLSKIFFKNMLELKRPLTYPAEVGYNTFWQIAKKFAKSPIPNWTGFMSNVAECQHTSKANITFLPLIDLKPSNPTCIYSTMLFVINQAHTLNIPTPVLTFDQPLWLKAYEIATSKALKIVLILGGFHTLMSFLGSIGYIMKGSGLEEAIGTIYGKNTVDHIMTGRAVTKALRAHYLTDAALSLKLLEKLDANTMGEQAKSRDYTMSADEQIAVNDYSAHDQEIDEKLLDMHKDGGVNEPKESHIDFTLLTETVNSFINGSTSLEEALASEEFIYTSQQLESIKYHFSTHSRTGKLWIQHMGYIDLIKTFIIAERIGNWELHLHALSGMINLFAASGHHHYAKSARLHLQDMYNLNQNYPWVYQCFSSKGFHSIRRSNKVWAGLWTDLVIEQTLMRSTKSRGGLTHRRGVTETVRNLWVGSMHRCASVHEAMGSLTGKLTKASEQHRDLDVSRITKDDSDLRRLSNWFDIHDPFPSSPGLHNIASGVQANSTIDCDRAELVGDIICRKLDNISSVKINKADVQVKSGVLFARLIALIQREDNILEHFKYELTPEPSSIFHDGYIRKAKKSDLRNHLFKKIKNKVEDIHVEIVVLDGGALLHKVSWENCSTYNHVIQRYVSFVKRYKAAKAVKVVFDGYTDEWSIKSQEHMLRQTNKSADINVSEDSNVTCNKESFLKNNYNKQQLIKLISDSLKVSGFNTKICDGDADTEIVKEALCSAGDGNKVAVYADDTDIVVLLIYHWRPNLGRIYFCTKVSQKKKATGLVKTEPEERYSIEELARAVGDDRKLILFVHAWGGCDTVSRIHSIGKTAPFQLIKDKDAREAAELFGSSTASQEDIGKAGCNLTIKSYRGRPDDSLQTLRYARYMETVSKGHVVKHENLPTTERAAHFRSLRVHLQVSIWKCLDTKALNPLKWGWHHESGVLSPIKTDIDAAAQSVLKYIRCNCKTTTNTPCSSKACTCVNNGLKCVAACGGCRGQFCENVTAGNELIADSNDNIAEDAFSEALRYFET